MRSLFLVLFLVICQVLSAQNIADRMVDLKFKNHTILHCLKAIEQAAGITFSYNLSTLKTEKKRITAKYKQERIGTVLNQIFEGTLLKYKEIANQITIYVDQINADNVNVSLSGYVLDYASEEKLIGAKVYCPSLQIGCISNPYGFYHIDIPQGSHQIIISSVGMKPLIKTITIENNLMLNFELSEDTLVLNAIEVTADADTSANLNTAVATLEKMVIEPKILSQTPSPNGLPDVTKYIQNIAGVQPLHDGSSSYQIRGLSNSNNLILLDEIPIYHPNHLLGIYSIINANAVKSASFYKDHIPAKFGIRNSSILQIYTKEGNLNKFQFSGGLGASVPHLSFEGPIVKKKASFYLSGRRSFDALSSINFLPPSDLPNPDFNDLTVKLNYKINYLNQIYFTSYIGNDKIVGGGDLLEDLSTYTWGNNAFSFRWNRVISDKVFANLTLINSIFNYKIDEASTNFGQKVISSQAKYDVSYFISNREKLHFGVSALNTRTLNDHSKAKGVFLSRNSYETGFYATLNKQINDKLSIDAGLRLPFYFHIGTQDTSVYLQPDQSQVEIVYAKNKPYDFKVSIDPRLLISYELNPKNTLQFSQNIATQFTHIINYNTKVLPVQIWTTPSRYLKPERNYQTSLALLHREKHVKLSSILFYRFVNHILDYGKNNYEPSPSFESHLLSGHLNAYGIELMAHYQKTEKYWAALSYSYTHARQKIDGMNHNQPYLPAYHRPHYVTLSHYYIKSKKWEFGGNFVFHSETALTLPTGKFEIDGVEYPLYDGYKSTSRLPLHHRLDLSFKRTFGIKKQKNRGALTITITNFYGRQNISNSFLSPANNGPLTFRNPNYIPQSLYLYYYIKI